MPKPTDQIVSIDARGFLRFVSATASTLNVEKFSYVDLYVDKIGKRIALKLSKKEQPGSFRLLEHEDRRLVFVKGALSEAGQASKSGRVTLTTDGDLLVLAGKSGKTGSWEVFPCRNSPSIPMASLDSRGTLILDRNCIEPLNIPSNDTATATYDAKKKELSFTLQKKKGDLNVRVVGSHANISLMGTLSSYGLPLPKSRLRLLCAIKGSVVKINLEDLAHSTR